MPEVVPPVCIGADGEQIGLPLVGRLADMWHNGGRNHDDLAAQARTSCMRSAEAAGRDPAVIETAITIERALPETDADSDRVPST